MAKRCKHRSNFKLTEKCKTCGNRRRCRRLVRRNREKVKTIIVTILILVIIVVAGVIFVSKIFKKENTEKVTTLVGIFQTSEVASKPDYEIKTFSENKEVQATAAQQVQSTVVMTLEQPVEEGTAEENSERFTESEKIAMGKTVYKEGRGEPEAGRIAIVAVILNRLETGSSEYGAENGNVMEVITFPGAFAYPKDMTDEFFKNCPEYELCMSAVEAAINGEDPTEAHFPGGARHFYSVVEPLSETARARREGVDTYVIGNQAFHNDMND